MAENQDNLTPQAPSAERITAPLAKAFKVKLEPTHETPDLTVQSFTYPHGDGFAQWSRERDGYAPEFKEVHQATAFMAAALETGGLAIAADSPTKLK